MREAAVPSRLQQGSILLLAAALLATGVAGGQWFMEADYVVFGYLDQTEWSLDAGYSAGEFWGLVLQSLCLPAAAVALMSFGLHSYKSSAWPAWMKAAVYLSLLVGLAVCAAIADETMTGGLVDCLWSLCENFSSTSSMSDTPTGFVPATGTMYFCVLVIFALMSALLFLRTAAEVMRGFCCSGSKGVSVDGFVTKEESQPLIGGTVASGLPAGDRGSGGGVGVVGAGSRNSSSFGRGARDRYSSRLRSTMLSPAQVGSMEMERRRARRLVSLFWLLGVFFGFLPLFIFASMSVDDGWEGMIAADVKTYASSSATQSYGTIWNIRLSSSVILKLFPDILIYWGFTYVVVMVALVARGWKRLERHFHAPFRPFGLRPRQLLRRRRRRPRNCCWNGGGGVNGHEKGGASGSGGGGDGGGGAGGLSRFLGRWCGGLCSPSAPYSPSSPSPPPAEWKNGEVFLAAAFFALLLCEGLYWYLDHGWGGASIDSKTWQERFARTMGQLANATMGLLVLPVLRNGVFQTVFGIGWESMVAFHRRMSRVFLALVLVHMVFFWAVYAQDGDFWHDWPIAIPTSYHEDNWTIPLATLTTWVMVIVMFGLSVQWVRRNHFEVFYYSHHFFLVVWSMMLWHAASAWYYICASIALWIVDRAIRFSKGLTIVSVKDLSAIGGATRMAYTVESGGVGPWGGSQRGMLHEAGQYVFINVPSISLLEWHPFTIASCPDDRETTHYIKDMGPTTFTGKLRMLATLGSQLQVNVDGPYGFPLEYDRYRLLVFVAGGIGVTPCLSLARHLSLLARSGGLKNCLEDGVRLIWTTRLPEEMLMLEAELQDVIGGDGEEPATDARFSVHLHLTSPSGMRRTSSLPFTEGRPDLRDYLQCFGRATDVPEKGQPVDHHPFHEHKQHQQLPPQRKGEALIFACGPTPLVEDASRAAESAGMDFHAETFEL